MTIMTNTTYELYYSNTDIACWKPMITIFVELIVLREDGYLLVCIKMVDNRLIHNIQNISELKGLFFVLLN